MARREFTKEIKRAALAGSSRDVTCSQCGVLFDRGYPICATRASRPQFCGPECQKAYQKAQAKIALASTFWSRTEKQDNGCLHWTGRFNSNGYGVIDHGNRPVLAHRMAYQLAYGVDPDKKFVCHSCDNPKCCNPDHLWLGDPSDNVADMDRKGRRVSNTRRGTRCNKAKLTEQIVREIRSSPLPNKELARRYGVSGTAISLIRNRKNWGWVA